MTGWIRWKLHKWRTSHHCYEWRAHYPTTRPSFYARTCTVCGETFE